MQKIDNVFSMKYNSIWTSYYMVLNEHLPNFLKKNATTTSLPHLDNAYSKDILSTLKEYPGLMNSNTIKTNSSTFIYGFIYEKFLFGMFDDQVYFLIGDPEAYKDLAIKLDKFKVIPEVKSKRSCTSVFWYYYNKQNELSRNRQFLFHDEYSHTDALYPYMNSKLKDFVPKFMKSSANILLLMGEPGTGKTSFIRSLAKEANVTNMYVTYDDNMMQDDEFYINFLQNSSGSDILLLEDADAFLTSREDSNNKVMKRLLNMTDGIVSYPSRKIIFSTNVLDINKIDSALIRPGRCYDVLKFKRLSTVEANTISSTPLPLREKGYTLAEIFNQKVAA